jgi:hypothetical protein
VEYFCPLCHILIFSDGKLTASHSCASAARHVIVLLKDAYAQALERTEREHAVITRRKKIIASQMSATEAQLDEVTLNRELVIALGNQDLVLLGTSTTVRRSLRDRMASGDYKVVLQPEHSLLEPNSFPGQSGSVGILHSR